MSTESVICLSDIENAGWRNPFYLDKRSELLNYNQKKNQFTHFNQENLQKYLQQRKELLKKQKKEFKELDEKNDDFSIETVRRNAEKNVEIQIKVNSFVGMHHIIENEHLKGLFYHLI